MTTPKKADITVARLRDLNAERKELREMVASRHEEANQLRAELRAKDANREFICQMLEAERAVLDGRLTQIGLTLHLLGQPSGKE